MKRSSWIRAGVSVTLLGTALFVLRARLSEVEPSEVFQRLRELPTWRLVAALALTVFNYVQLTLYDVLGLAYLRRLMPYRRVALASFVATAFGHNVGFSFAASGSVRYRYFSAWGLSTGEVAGLVGFGSLTYLTGFAAVAGAMLLSTPDGVGSLLPLDPVLLRGIGAALLLLGLGYVALSVFGPGFVTLKGRSFELPRPALVVGQIFVSSCDWLVMAGILKLLLPASVLDYASLLRVLVLAQVAGTLSQVPGGLGVFESLMVTALTPALSASAVLGTLLFYRVFYFFIPFAVAIALFSLNELRRRAGDAPAPLTTPPAPPTMRRSTNT
jgi:phosphatidylglycerol lysyltransferase